MAKIFRLDKFLADAGTGTRSEVKKYIQKGYVQVNGEVIRRPEFKVTEEDAVMFNGEKVGVAPEFVYYILHKPAGCVSATEDSREKTVMEYIPDKRKGLFPVGRLDKDTEGLLLITDDGALAHELLSPRKHVDKTYYARVTGKVTDDDLVKLRKGIDIGEKNLTLPANLEILSVKETEGKWESEIHLTICEGKFHQVKRMMEALGKKVVYLRRISMGVLTLKDDLAPGQCRPLTGTEINALKTTKK